MLIRKFLAVALKIVTISSGCLFFLPSAHAQHAYIRFDPPSVDVTIDALNNITGNNPIKIYVSHTDSGAFCSKASEVSFRVEDLPGAGFDAYAFSQNNSGPGAGTLVAWPAHPPYNVNLINSGKQLCNINETDVTPAPYLLTPINIFGATDPIVPIVNTHHPEGICNAIGRPGSYGKQYLVKATWNDNAEVDGIYTMTIHCLAPTYTATVNGTVSLQGDSSGNVSGNTQIGFTPLVSGGPACPTALSVWVYGYHTFLQDGQSTSAPGAGYQIGDFRAGTGANTDCPGTQRVSGSALQASEIDFCKSTNVKTVNALRPADVYFCSTVNNCQNNPSFQEAVVRVNIPINVSCAVTAGTQHPSTVVASGKSVASNTKANIGPALGPDVGSTTINAGAATHQARIAKRASSDDGKTAQAAPVITPGFPWGHTWTATYGGTDHVWKFLSLQDAGFGFFQDKDEVMATFEVRTDGILHGEFQQCRMTGPYDAKAKIITLATDSSDDGCKEIGTRVVIKVSD